MRQPNRHGGCTPKAHWGLPWEREAVKAFREQHRDVGYRYLTYMMLDADIVALSSSTVYRILKAEGLLSAWNTRKTLKKKGFDQPVAIHEHWHVDIKYVNFHGTFLFLISVIDGFSRYIVHHELRMTMVEYDVQLTIERALLKAPGYHPRIISDNGSQFIAKDFSEYIKAQGLRHVRTSVNHPQSNGKIERFHRSISEECLRVVSFLTISDARRQIAEYIEYYNTKRLHSAIHFLTPEEMLTGKSAERLAERKAKIAQAAKARREIRKAA
jgi:putative transposase